MRVIGTAGHVDHGKSTLVQALSGIDPDRLKEEKARGLTIDLGFAWVDLPATDTDSPESVGIVDVPGHIDFIKNMLAGVGGIDAAILIIAADEGVMPQTREHLAILDLLAVPTGVVALTKTDVIDDPEWLDLVELDVAETLQETRLADAPIVRVSALTGNGLDDLLSTLAHLLHDLEPRRDRKLPRLPIDRIFSLSGFGTIVTGTLNDGEFRVGDDVEIMPSGRNARIRGLQTHGEQIEVGLPGSRLAMNLTGVSTDQLHRGEVVAKPGTAHPTTLLDVSVRLLNDAVKALEHNQIVDFFSGAAEVQARVRLIGKERIEPGEEGWLQLRLASPVVVAAGDRYILRQPSPSATLGGGEVLSPHPGRRWRRFDDAVQERFRTLAGGVPEDVLLYTVNRNPFSTRDQTLELSGLDLSIAQEGFDTLLAQEQIRPIGSGQEPAWVTLPFWERLLSQVQGVLGAYHKEYPLKQGMPREELRNRLRLSPQASTLSVRLFNDLVSQWVASDDVGADDTSVWRGDFSITLSVAQQQSIDQLLARFDRTDSSGPSVADALSLLNNESELLDMLVDQGKLVRLAEGILYRKEDFAQIGTEIESAIRQNGSITLAETRDLLNTSRKYAQAILEEMDARRLTRRQGDARVLRNG